MFIKELIQFLIKYGGILAPLYLVRWKYFKIKSKSFFGKRILTIDKSVFLPKGHSKFRNLYQGSYDEFIRISNGERKILFYDDNDENKEYDIKTQWELKRCQHVPILATYSRGENGSQISAFFCKKNLEELLVKTNAMEVAISSINMVTSFRLLEINNKNGLENNIAEHLKSSLAYLVSNYEKGIRYSANHYFFNLLGALWICESITGNKFIQKFKKKTQRQLITLLKQIVTSDGSLYEGSTHYHKYVVESLLLFLYEFEEEYKNKNEIHEFARQMAHFAFKVSKNNSIIGIGDNDSGRLLPLPTYFDYKSSDLSLINDLTLFLNIDTKTVKHVKKNFNDNFGLYFLRNEVWHVAIRLETGIKKYRKSIGVHCHNDQLHLIVEFKSQHLFVDKGTYSYVNNDNLKEANISTASHNTIMIAGIEQYKLPDNWHYYHRYENGKRLYYNSHDTFKGSFVDCKKNFFTRTVKLNNKQLIIEDAFIKRNEFLNEEVYIFFHLHPNASLELLSKCHAIISINNRQISFSVYGGTIEISKYIFSSEYGKKEIASKIITKSNRDLNNVIFKIE